MMMMMMMLRLSRPNHPSLLAPEDPSHPVICVRLNDGGPASKASRIDIGNLSLAQAGDDGARDQICSSAARFLVETVPVRRQAHSSLGSLGSAHKRTALSFHDDVDNLHSERKLNIKSSTKSQ
jgi:hypothetical protein